jgi:hypothetical protein
MPARDEITRTCCGILALYGLLHDIQDDIDLLYFKAIYVKSNFISTRTKEIHIIREYADTS